MIRNQVDLPAQEGFGRMGLFTGTGESLVVGGHAEVCTVGLPLIDPPQVEVFYPDRLMGTFCLEPSDPIAIWGVAQSFPPRWWLGRLSGPPASFDWVPLDPDLSSDRVGGVVWHQERDSLVMGFPQWGDGVGKVVEVSTLGKVSVWMNGYQLGERSEAWLGGSLVSFMDAEGEQVFLVSALGHGRGEILELDSQGNQRWVHPAPPGWHEFGEPLALSTSGKTLLVGARSEDQVDSALHVLALDMEGSRDPVELTAQGTWAYFGSTMGFLTLDGSEIPCVGTTLEDLGGRFDCYALPQGTWLGCFSVDQENGWQLFPHFVPIGESELAVLVQNPSTGQALLVILAVAVAIAD